VSELLDALDRLKRVRPPDAGLLPLLDRLSAEPLDAAGLARFHDALLFLCAYPPSTAVRKRAGRLLDGFAGRVAGLDDRAPLDDPEVSGIAGAPVSMAYSFPIARFLASRFPGRLTIAWDELENAERLAAGLPRFLPMLPEESLADANVPYESWVRNAVPPGLTDAEWLLSRFASLPNPPPEKAELFEALGLPLRFDPGDTWASRTRLRVPVPRADLSPPVPRRDVDLARQLGAPPRSIERLSAAEGETLLDFARAAMAVRYRELHGFTHGDPRSVFRADAGRGVEIFVAGLAPEARLPLRAGLAAFLFRNGVPVGYGDAFALFERLDVTFNVFPAFREGEAAWLYARLLAFYRELLSVTAFFVDPYQIGAGNEEALDSGAFWFYRKLGFRALRPELEELARREEARAAADPAHRSGKRVLARLSEGGLVYEGPGSEPGAWDRFHIRTLCLASAGAPLLSERLRRAKRGRDELGYLALLRRDRALRARMLELVSRNPDSLSVVRSAEGPAARRRDVRWSRPSTQER